jgi:hypothetical protein
MYERQDQARWASGSRLRVASALRLVGVLALASAACFVVHWNRVGQTLLCGAAFFALVLCLELLRLRRHRRWPSRGPEEPEPTRDFEVIRENGDAWREKRVRTHGHVVAVRVPFEDFDSMLVFAQRAVAQSDAIVAKAVELLRGDSDQSQRLTGIGIVPRVLAIEFYNRKRPDVGEVSFAEPFEDVTCLCRGGQCFDLSAGG